MSDLKKDNEIKEIYLVESDESSTEAQNCGVTIQNVIKEVVQASASEQFENVLDSNKAVITNRNNASEMLQTKEIGQEGMTGSLMPHKSVQAPTNELPRIAEDGNILQQLPLSHQGGVAGALQGQHPLIMQLLKVLVPEDLLGSRIKMRVSQGVKVFGQAMISWRNVLSTRITRGTNMHGFPQITVVMRIKNE